MSKADSSGGISRHFLRETKILVGLFLAPIVLAVLVGLFGPQLLRFLEVDRCLDAGGSYDYDAGICKVEPAEK
jgi:hypothetical protein